MLLLMPVMLKKKKLFQVLSLVLFKYIFFATTGIKRSICGYVVHLHVGASVKGGISCAYVCVSYVCVCVYTSCL